MDILTGVADFLTAIGILGGIAGIIAASGWAQAERIRAERRGTPQSAGNGAPETVLSELQALKQQINEMQGTSHQFDISFDAALSRLEERVSRVETKVVTLSSSATEVGETQRLGIR